MSGIRAVVSGVGRVGREMLAALHEPGDVTLVGVLRHAPGERVYHLPNGTSVLCGSDAAALFQLVEPQVVIDFSHHTWAEQIVPIAIDAGVRPVVGTTGFSLEFIHAMAARCEERGLGAVFAPNFAIGAVLMTHFARIAARYFDHAEIIELHHDRKLDAPSGTGLAAARAMVEAKGGPFTRAATEKFTLEGTRGGEEAGVTIHSVRLPGLIAHHEIIFADSGQTLTLRHDSMNRASFVPGVLLAVREVMQRQELVYGLDRLMGLEG